MNRAAVHITFYGGMALPAVEWPMGYAVENRTTIRLLTGDVIMNNDAMIETETTAPI